MTSGSSGAAAAAASPLIPTLGLFCATACLYRHLTLRREEERRVGVRRSSWRHYGAGDADASFDDHEANLAVHHAKLRKRVSFDGLQASDHFPLDDGDSPVRARASEQQQQQCVQHAAMGSVVVDDGVPFNSAMPPTPPPPPWKRRVSWMEDDSDSPRSFVIYGGDEMDDDEVADGGGGGVLTSAGASAMRTQTAAMGKPTPRTRDAKEMKGMLKDELNGLGYYEVDAGAKGGKEEGTGRTSTVSELPRQIRTFLRQMSGGGGIGRSEDGFFVDAAAAAAPPDDSNGAYFSFAGDAEDDGDGERPPPIALPDKGSGSKAAGVGAVPPPNNKRSYHRMESARADYNAKIMPSKLVMVRHGQSEGNVEENLYATTPDNAMKLTRLGWDQARMAGRELRERVLAGAESVHFIVSPYVRTVETFHGIVSAWCDPSEFDHIADRDKKIGAWYGRLMEMGLTWHEDPRIREQDFGNYQDPVTIKKCKRERHKFGSFYYRFPHGESASDVFDRVSTFLDSLWRSFDLKRSQNYVLVTHGISIRVLLARYFRYSIDQFNTLANPKNCDMILLGHDGAGKLRLEGRYDLKLKSAQSPDEDEEGREEEAKPSTPRKQIVGYKFHGKLRVLPIEWIEKREIRLAFDD